MNLRTKLFLSVSILLIFISLMVYFLPKYLVQTDLNKAAVHIVNVVQNQQQKVIQLIAKSVETEFQQFKENLDNLLMVVADDFQKKQPHNEKQIEQVGEQLALINSNFAFLQHSSSNDRSFIYPTNLKPLSLSIVSQYQHFLLINKGDGKILLAKTHKEDAELITLAMALSDILKISAESLNQTVVFQFDHQQVAFSPDGKYLPNFTILSSQASSGVVQVDQVAMNFNRLTLHVIDEPIVLYFLIPQSEAFSISNFLSSIKQAIEQKISRDLATVILLCLIITLPLLLRITKTFSRPIKALAEASLLVGRGRYDGIHLPSLKIKSHELNILYEAFDQMILMLKDRERVRGVLNKVVSKEIAAEILNSKINLEGEERHATIFFSDIRGFTKYSEETPTLQLFQTVNSYLNLMCNIVERNRGVVDKFVGDEIMALYGLPIDHPHHAAQAITTAIQMMKRLVDWDDERQKQSQAPFTIGIGIHSGELYAGNVGAEDRLNYTVLGATVNLASRLCSAAKPMQILVSKETWQAAHVDKNFLGKELPPIQLKGIEQPVICYEIDWMNHNKS